MSLNREEEKRQQSSLPKDELGSTGALKVGRGPTYEKAGRYPWQPVSRNQQQSTTIHKEQDSK